MRPSPSALRQEIPTEYVHIKEALRKRKDLTSHRVSLRKPLRAIKLKNVASTLTRRNQQFEIKREDNDRYSITKDTAQNNDCTTKPKSSEPSQGNKGSTKEDHEMAKPKPKSETVWNKPMTSTSDKNSKDLVE